jgi:WD40 repeat protein
MKRIFLAIALLAITIAVAYWVFYPSKPSITFQILSQGPAEGSSLSNISAITRSRDGRVLGSVTDNKKLRLWEAATGQPLREMESTEKEWIYSPAFLPDASACAAVDSVSAPGRQYGEVVFWNPDSGERTATIEDFNWPHSMKFNAGGTLAAVGGTSDLYLVDVGTHEIAAKVEKAHSNGPIQALDFNGSGDLLATSGRDGLVKLWHVPDLKLVRSFSVAQTVRPRRSIDGPVTVAATAVLFSHDQTLLAASTEEASIYFWEVETGRELQKYLGDKLRPDQSFPSGVENSLIFTTDDSGC